MRRWLPLVLVVLVAFSFTPACGDDDDDGGGSDVDASEPADEGSGSEASVPEDDDEPAPDQEDGDEPTDDAFLRFTALGVDSAAGLLEFGAAADEVVALVSETWGEPESDTGDAATGVDCPSNAATYRRVEWEDLYLEFLDDEFKYWLSSSPDQDALSFVGDETQVSITPGETTVSELENQLGNAFEAADEPPLGPTFTITDNWGELGGELSEVGGDGVVQSVRAGIGCGE